MIKIYVRMINEGRLTLEQVPSKWREQVRAALENQ